MSRFAGARLSWLGHGVAILAGVIAERLTAQLLAGPPATDPVAVAERLVAIQAQDPRGARLAVRARTKGLTAADVDRALTGDRSLVVTWLNRGTLHLVRSEDYAWLHALTTPPLFTGNARRVRLPIPDPQQRQRRGVEHAAREAMHLGAKRQQPIGILVELEPIAAAACVDLADDAFR